LLGERIGWGDGGIPSQSCSFVGMKARLRYMPAGNIPDLMSHSQQFFLLVRPAFIDF